LFKWTPLSELRSGDRIAVARSVPVFGSTAMPEWEAVLLGLMIAEGQCDTPVHSPVFTTSEPALAELLATCVTEGQLGEVSHINAFGYRIVNRKGRGSVMTGHGNRAARWLASHGVNVKAADKFVPRAIFRAPKDAVRLFLRALFTGDGSIMQHGDAVQLEYYSMSRRLIEDVHHLLLRFSIASFIREKRTHLGSMTYRIQITDLEQIAGFARQIGFWPGSRKQHKLEQDVVPYLRNHPKRKSNFDTLPEAIPLLRAATYSIDSSLNALGVTGLTHKQSVSPATATRVAQAAPRSELATLVDEGPIWDAVESITYAGEEEVFDLTVPEHHNFLANDIYVHNSTYARCGLIVNVTPLEPEWQGYLTLEISNTTPLPAKVYANEGIAQLLFLAGDGVCDSSYADKKGKYQGQTEITLPRIETHTK
jgi:deoxycytidine triphosphate deaminase